MSAADVGRTCGAADTGPRHAGAKRFWLALRDAVRQACPPASRADPPAATPDFNAPAMVDRVLSELADTRGDITLVIDDLHELNSPEALAQLTRLLMNLPPH